MTDSYPASAVVWKNGKPTIKGGARPKPKRIALAECVEPTAAGRGMNQLETDYAQLLENRPDVLHWEFEPIRFRLAGGAWYKPDFGVLLKNLQMEIHETKGHWREAARVRIKTAAERHWYFKFIAVTRDAGGWQYETMPPHKEPNE